MCLLFVYMLPRVWTYSMKTKTHIYVIARLCVKPCVCLAAQSQSLFHFALTFIEPLGYVRAHNNHRRRVQGRGGAWNGLMGVHMLLSATVHCQAHKLMMIRACFSCRTSRHCSRKPCLCKDQNKQVQHFKMRTSFTVHRICPLKVSSLW